MRAHLLLALKVHPEAVTHVNVLRPTPIDGLGPKQSKRALELIARGYDDVADALKQKKHEDLQVVERLNAHVKRATETIHSLDRLSSRWQHEKSHEVSPVPLFPTRAC